jgi:hypothetical protein
MTPALKETLAFILTAASIPVLEALVKLDANAVLAEPKPWLIGIAAAAIRAAAGAVLGKLVARQIVPHG